MATLFLDIDENFSATKQNPVVIHTWKVWKNHIGFVTGLAGAFCLHKKDGFFA